MKTQALLLLVATVTLATALFVGTGISKSGSREITLLVPIAYAAQWGADRWDESLREQFLNDQGNLVRLSREEIRNREGRGPENWLPASGQCDYLGKFMAVMERYKLHHRHDQWRDLVVKRQRC